MHTGRLFEILYYLQAHGSATARQLAQRFEVSERTIRRDIDALSAAGVPVYTRPGRTGGVALLEGYRLDTALLSEAEQTVLARLRGMAGLGGESAATAGQAGALAHPGTG
ncbi:MAG: helix-turn-helix transcriptional regulator [Ruthenibacterium sp.]